MSSASRVEKLSFARKMVSQLEAALLDGAGIVSVSADGVSTTFKREQALLELEWWRKQVIRYGRKRSRVRGVNLSNADS